ncbi:phage tail sheath family protein [Herbaspirillum robiniae]|nr:phage tail sheath family protein [Herbaspirillum robiniae]
MNAPGVTIEEVGLTAASVRSSATVPVFIGYFYNKKTGNVLPISTGCIRFNNALELRQYFANTVPAPVKISGADVSLSGSSIQPGAIAINHYFENGGGPCYILPYSANVTGMADYIREHEDITLITTTFANDNIGLPALMTELKPLLEDGKGRFFVATASARGFSPFIPDGPVQDIGSYHPYLTLTSRLWRDDAETTVSGYSDSSIDTLAKLKTASPALYAKADALIKERLAALKTIAVSPGPAVAAAYCRTDRERGVWKAPANIVINDAEPYSIIPEKDHGKWNEKGVNIIRKMNGKTVIFGARTLAVDSEQWRYVSVRRLFNKIQRDIGELMRHFADAPNTQDTWTRAKSIVDAYLHDIWSQGGLKGSRPEQGYQVALGKDETMDDDDIAAGRMIAQIKLAASRPAEFIILRFSQELL